MFNISRLNADNIFKEKDLMDVYVLLAVVFSSQRQVDANLQEGNLDLVLVSSLDTGLTSKEWLRHSKLGNRLACGELLTMTEREQKHTMGTNLLPRLIQLAFENSIENDLKRKVIHVIHASI
jgi:hypothetical protein